MKPDGQFTLAPDVATIMDFVATLPIRKVCGIGKASSRNTSLRPCSCDSLTGPLHVPHYNIICSCRTSLCYILAYATHLRAHLPTCCDDDDVLCRSPSKC